MRRLWQWIARFWKSLLHRHHRPTIAVGRVTYGKDHQPMDTTTGPSLPIFSPDVHFTITDNQAVDLDVEFERKEHGAQVPDTDLPAKWSSDDAQQAIASFTPGPTSDLNTKQPITQDPLLRKCRLTAQVPGDVTITVVSGDGGAAQRFICHIVRPIDSVASGSVSAPVEQDAAAPVTPAGATNLDPNPSSGPSTTPDGSATPSG